ncbi:hypothetical protein RRG08_045297 [Elysia crispata]|uniref:Uncharacterized protein n=1 Tax=Elysia crispata TaxID=231223 RepID=A0AAE1DQR4_9GAST|nr:hypothetical protein RRG08_045297 [Elysia crispata]
MGAFMFEVTRATIPKTNFYQSTPRAGRPVHTKQEDALFPVAAQPIGEQNGEHIIGHRKDPEDKRHLVENQELPPKYSATNGVNGSSRTPQDGGADDEEPEKKAPKVGTMALRKLTNRNYQLPSIFTSSLPLPCKTSNTLQSSLLLFPYRARLVTPYYHHLFFSPTVQDL